MNGWQADPEGIMNLASQIRNTYNAYMSEKAQMFRTIDEVSSAWAGADASASVGAGAEAAATARDGAPCRAGAGVGAGSR